MSSPNPWPASARAAEAALVGPALLVVDGSASTASTATTAGPLATASILMSTHLANNRAAATVGDDWASALIASLTSMGWVTGGIQSRSINPASISRRKNGSFQPWELLQSDLTAQLSGQQTALLDRWASVLQHSAAKPLQGLWRTATTVAPGHRRCTVAVASSGSDAINVAIGIGDLSYPRLPPGTPIFPWGQWPTSGAALEQTIAELTIDATTGGQVLAELTPKVAPVLRSEVHPITA